MPKVTQKYPSENVEKMLSRFKRAIEKDNLIQECRKREFYEKPSETRKRAKAAAKKRWQKRSEELNQRGFIE